MNDGVERARVGLLFVHGVGEQKAFHHLCSECRSLVETLRSDPQVRDLSVHTATSRDGSFGASQETWCAEGRAPVIFDFTCQSTPVRLECHEVWWADLDADDSLVNQLRFWVWGLGQWFVRRGEPSEEDRARLRRLGIRLPARDQWLMRQWVRAQLIAVGAYFFLALVTLTFANFLLSRLAKGRIPGARVLVRYVGDVKLYQQERWLRAMPPLADLHHPPRVSIRRRIVSAMVQMYRAGYDRWYVCAHSLGSVVAYNALTETEHCLPNYLPEELWEACREGFGKRCPPTSKGAEMMPERPSWLRDEDHIDRRELFKALKGFVTYGSPLDKFATLWPKIVPINDQWPFADDFEWINVYDPTDRISGHLDAFEQRPRNLAYRAHWGLLYSHLCYMRPQPEGGDSLAQRLLRWSARGGSFPEPVPEDGRWMTGQSARWWRSRVADAQAIGGFAMLALLAALVTVPLLAALVELLAPGEDQAAAGAPEASTGVAESVMESWLRSLEWAVQWVVEQAPMALPLAAVALAITLLCGLLVRLGQHWTRGRSAETTPVPPQTTVLDSDQAAPVVPGAVQSP